MKYRIGNNLTGPYSFFFSSIEKARGALRKERVSVARIAVRNSGGRLSFEEARVIVKDYCWICDEHLKIVE